MYGRPLSYCDNSANHVGIEDETAPKAKVGDRVRSFANLTMAFMEVNFMAAKNVKIKVKIDSEKLRKMISEKSSVRKIGEQGICSDRTIRRGLKIGWFTVDTVSYLAYYLGVSPESFADIDRYFAELRDYIYHWEGS